MGFRVYISADMEGVSGVVSAGGLSPRGSDYARYRGFMTADVNAAVDGALDAGASEVVVNDAHGSMCNILIEELHPEASLISGASYELGMMRGIDEGFSCAFLVGYHSMSSGKGLFSGSFSGVRELYLNGRPAGEGDVSAMIAAHFGVPVVMTSGDDHAVGEIIESVGLIEGAVVKHTLGLQSARCLPLCAARDAIRRAARRACARVEKATARPAPRPATLEVEFSCEDLAERASVIPSVEPLGRARLRFSARDALDAWRVFSAVLRLGGEQRLC